MSVNARPKTKFEVSEQAWESYDARVRDLASKPTVGRVLEIGGGANPTLPLDFIEQRGLEYVVLDVSSEELAKAPDGYQKVQGDITSPNLRISGDYDLVFSRTVAEHVRSGLEFHRSVLGLLSEGGTAFHFFPTLCAPPFVVNRLLPESLSENILLMLQPDRKRESKHAKFPCYYSWCRGPSSRQIRKFESLGYRVDEYVGFFGHDGYYRRLERIRRVHKLMSSALARHPVSWLTSYAYVVLSKPEA